MDESAYLSLNLLWALLFLTTIVLAWILNTVSAPGNWVMVILASVYWWLMPAESPYAIGGWVLTVLVALAIVGEILEFGTSALGTRYAGGSRRGAWLSILGSLVGSITGIFLGIPIPVIGSLLAALLFAGVGAMLGAYFGERWDGKSNQDAWRVGWASFCARLIGSLAKLLVGMVMIAIAVAAMVI